MPDPGQDRMDRALAAAFAPAAPRLPGDSVLADIESAPGLGADPASGVGRYRMSGEIGRGGLGVVYAGRDRDVARDVALKVLRPDRLGSRDLLRRFVEEAQIAGQLEHPGVVPVYDLGLVEGGIPYFTMRRVRGSPLSDLLAHRESPAHDLPRFLGLFEQICHTLAYAHARGVIHRDLKPANVMVGVFGEVQVLDWGLAKVLDARERDAAAGERPATIRTQDVAAASLVGTVLGTPQYMAPEQARGDLASMDERTDVFALGGILLEILTGEPPCGGDATDEVLRASQTRPEALRDRLATWQVDDALAALCERCLAWEPSERPAGAADVAAAVAGYLADRMERARRAELAATRERMQATLEDARATRAARGVDAERRARRRTRAVALTLLLAGFLGGASFLYVSVSNRVRHDRAAAAVAETLEDASRLEGEGRLGDALAAARLALERARAGGAARETLTLADASVGRLEQAVAEERASALEAERVDALLAELERLRKLSSADVRPDPDATDAQYVRAFATFGVDLAGMSPEEVASRIAGGPRSAEIAAALVALAFNRRENAGRGEEAWRPLLEAARLADPRPWSQHLVEAALARDAQALRQLAATADLEDLPARSVYLLGHFLAAQKDHALAADVFRRGRRRFPDDAWIARKLAQSVGTLGTAGQREAVNQAMAVVALQPGHACHWSELGMRLLVAGDLAGALRAGRESLAREPVHAAHHGRLGWALLAAERLPEAEAALREALALEDDRANDWGNLAAALVGQGKHEEGLQAARRALELAPALFPPRLMQAQALHGLGRNEEAQALLRDCIRDQPQRGGPRVLLAQLLIEAGAYEEAHGVLEEGVKALPGHWRLLCLLGDSYSAQGRHAEALDAYGRAARSGDPAAGEVWIRLAACHARLGHREEAARWLARGAAWMDAHAPADELLGRLRAEVEAFLGEGGGRR